MSVYVDDWYAPYCGMLMCHLMADTHSELLDMIDKIGVQRKWIQAEGTWREHFDICKSKRELALRNGTIEMDSKSLVKKMLDQKKISI